MYPSSVMILLQEPPVVSPRWRRPRCAQPRSPLPPLSGTSVLPKPRLTAPVSQSGRINRRMRGKTKMCNFITVCILDTTDCWYMKLSDGSELLTWYLYYCAGHYILVPISLTRWAVWWRAARCSTLSRAGSSLWPAPLISRSSSLTFTLSSTRSLQPRLCSGSRSLSSGPLRWALLISMNYRRRLGEGPGVGRSNWDFP